MNARATTPAAAGRGRPVPALEVTATVGLRANPAKVRSGAALIAAAGRFVVQRLKLKRPVWPALRLASQRQVPSLCLAARHHFASAACLELGVARASWPCVCFLPRPLVPSARAAARPALPSPPSLRMTIRTNLVGAHDGCALRAKLA